MTQGERRTSDVELFDATYDGIHSPPSADGPRRLYNGLGQLVDGEEGQSNFRLDPKSLGVKGYEWIGWRNDSFAGAAAAAGSGGACVEISFKFDAVRNFSALRIVANNMFSKDVRVFRSARVAFSVGGVVYSSPPVVYDYMRDSLIEYFRPVVVPLLHGIGRYVRVQLFFDSRWMMISEVQFESGES